MKKSLLSIIGLTAIMTLTGCNAEAASSGSKDIVFPVTDIALNASSRAMLVGEKFAVQPLVTPLLASKAKLFYTSSNPEVATVSDKGVITAKSQGTATIKVSNGAEDEKEVFANLTVYVLKKQSKEAVQSSLESMLAYQKTYVKKPKKLFTNEVETRTLYVNGKVFQKTYENIDLILSKNDAYFYVGGIDTEIKYYNAPEHRSSFGYHFYTDSDYHSFLYHENDSVHNWCYVPTEFYLGTGTTRDGVLYAMMNSFFVSGSDFAENNVSNSMSDDLLIASGRKMCYTGGFGDNTVFAKYKITYEDEKAGIDEENNLDIPAGTIYDEVLNISAYWDKGNVKSYNVNFTLTYKLNGKNCVLDINRDYTFLRDDFSFSLPDRTKYNEVDNVFDL